MFLLSPNVRKFHAHTLWYNKWITSYKHWDSFLGNGKSVESDRWKQSSDMEVCNLNSLTQRNRRLNPSKQFQRSSTTWFSFLSAAVERIGFVIFIWRSRILILKEGRAIVQGVVVFLSLFSDGTGTVLKAGRWQVRFPMESFRFVIDLVIPAALWPWGRFSL